MTASLSRLMQYALPLAVGLLIWSWPLPAGLEPRAWQMFAVFVATIVGIIAAPQPMSVVALIGATAGTLLGVISFGDVVASIGTDLVWLIMLAFFISRGIIKSGLGRRVALLFMRLLGRTTLGLGYGLAITELMVAPAMPSITARAGGVLLPITKAIAEVLGSRPDEATRGRVGSYLILCAFHANVITAGMFVTAMAGNPLVVKLAGGQGVQLGWLDWAIAAAGPGLLCLALVPLLMLWIVKPQVRRTPDAIALAQRELQAMGPMSRNEWVAAFVFVGLLVLWVAGDAIGIGATLAAAIGVCLMLLAGVLTWNDALEEKSAWDTMIWIGLLIMLASKLNEYGMVAWFGTELGALLAGLGQYTVFVLISLIYFYVRYFFASATAHIAALFPVCLALMVAAGVPPFAGAIALGALSSVCGCLTQYAIGSSPVMFGAGYVSQREWWRAGFIASLVYLPVWLVGGPLWWSVIGRY